MFLRTEYPRPGQWSYSVTVFHVGMWKSPEAGAEWFGGMAGYLGAGDGQAIGSQGTQDRHGGSFTGLDWYAKLIGGDHFALVKTLHRPPECGIAGSAACKAHPGGWGHLLQAHEDRPSDCFGDRCQEVTSVKTGVP